MNRRKMITLSILILCILFIWSNSLQTGELSGARSGRVTEWMEAIFGPDNPFSEHVIRKAAHFGEYAAEGVCVVLVFWAFAILRWRSIGNGLLIGVFTALIDELLQAGTAGRVSSVVDVWIDISGFAFGALVLIFVKRYLKEKK